MHHFQYIEKDFNRNSMLPYMASKLFNRNSIISSTFCDILKEAALFSVYTERYSIDTS